MRRPACLLVAAAFALLLVVGLSAGAAQAQDTGKTTEPATGDDAPQPAPAKEKKITGETLALEASDVQNKHCADAYGRDTTRALQSIATVAEVWARVSEQYEKSGETFLLYWRGVLAQCMDQEERGLTDLKGFVAESGSSTLWVALVKDANRRIRQLERKTGISSARPTPLAPDEARAAAGVILGGSLAAGSALSGVVAGIRWQEALDRAGDIYTVEVDNLEDNTLFKEGRTNSQQGIALGAASIAMGAGALVSFIIAARAGSEAGAEYLPPLLVPTATGAVVTWEARW
jgi:hypothetical protein